jgi:hypothetical protein
MNDKEYVDHEVRIRELEKILLKINNRLNWGLVIFGGILTSIVIPITLHFLKLE